MTSRTRSRWGQPENVSASDRGVLWVPRWRRCAVLKPRLSDVVYRQLVANAGEARMPEEAGPGGHCGADTSIQRGQLDLIGELCTRTAAAGYGWPV